MVHSGFQMRSPDFGKCCFALPSSPTNAFSSPRCKVKSSAVDEAVSEVKWRELPSGESQITLRRRGRNGGLCRRRFHNWSSTPLGGNTKPIGVAEWDTQLSHSLPKELQASLPAIEQIEAELSREEDS